jgi:hypothetical protein
VKSFKIFPDSLNVLHYSFRVYGFALRTQNAEGIDQALTCTLHPGPVSQQSVFSSTFFTIFANYIIEALCSYQRRTDPPFGGELGEANALAGIQIKLLVHK